MSIALMSMAWWLDLSPMQQSVLLVLCDHADDFGENCFPSVGLISWKLGRSRRHIQRTLRELESIGIIAVDELGGGRENTTRYRITLENGVRKSPFSPKHSATSCPEKATSEPQRATSEPQRATSETRKGDTGVTRTIIEPSEPSVNHHSSSAERSSSLRVDALVIFRELNTRGNMRLLPTRESIDLIVDRIERVGRDVVLGIATRKIIEWTGTAREKEIRPRRLYGEDFDTFVAELSEPVAFNVPFSEQQLKRITAPWPVGLEPSLDYEMNPESDAALRFFFGEELADAVL